MLPLSKCRLLSFFVLSREQIVHNYFQSLGFKSQYNLDKVYPSSDPDILKSEKHIPNETENENFSGYIPIEQLDIKYTKGGGPGGQNVNKVNSKVEMRFHVDSAQWIPQWVRPKLLLQEKNRVTKDGYLIVESEKTRKQVLNQADCVDKIRRYIYKCSVIPREATDEKIALRESRLLKAQQSILREKRAKSLKKHHRQSPSVHSVV